MVVQPTKTGDFISNHAASPAIPVLGHSVADVRCFNENIGIITNILRVSSPWCQKRVM